MFLSSLKSFVAIDQNDRRDSVAIPIPATLSAFSAPVYLSLVVMKVLKSIT